MEFTLYRFHYRFHYPPTLPSDITLSKNYPTDTVGKAPHLANDNIFVAHLKPTNTIDTR